eukprot:m.27820 g.27820  ORF g.27820 m.27820 type:complete len:266 (-) comp15816_c0_seq1:401-1198(-)
MFAKSYDGVELWYEDWQPIAGVPRKPSPLILSHGFDDSSQLWSEQIESLIQNGFRVIAWDMRGHGKSKAPAHTSGYSKMAQVEDILAIYEACSLSNAILVGHSMGAYDQQLFALRYPSMITGMVLYGTGPGFGSEKGWMRWNEQADKIAKSRDESNPTVAAFCRGSYKQRSEDPFYQQLEHGQTTLLKSLKTFKMPTAILIGDRDKTFLGASKLMKREIPNSTLTIIEDGGHMVIKKKPQEFQQHLLSSLKWICEQNTQEIRSRL